MNRIAIVVLAVLAGVFSPPQHVQGQSGLRRVCYHTNWSQYRNGAGKFVPENVDPTLCTHLVYAFATIENNSIKAYEWNDESETWSTGMYEKFQALKLRSPGVKTLLAVGGWNMASGPFTQMVASPTSRAQFVQSVVAYLREWGFDGLDVDWEYPANRGSPPQDRDLFTDLVRELRANFEHEAASSGRPRLLLSAAVAAGKPNIDTAYDIPAINQHLDFMNLMTYDLHGSWETYTGHHTALFPRSAETGDDRYLNVDWAAKYWVQKGASPSKLNIGLALYGRTFTLTSPSQTGIGAPALGPGREGQYTLEKGFVSYYEVCQMIQHGAQVHDEPEQHVRYLSSGDQWVGYEDTRSLTEKTCYIKQNGYGGIMVWALSEDDFSGTMCSSGKYPLMHAINNELNNPSFNNCPRPYQAPAITAAPVTHTPLPSSSSPTGLISSTTGFSCMNKPNDFYPNPYVCRQYYICANQVSYAVECASGLVYNAVTRFCDWPQNVAGPCSSVAPAQTQLPPVITTPHVITTTPVITTPHLITTPHMITTPHVITTPQVITTQHGTTAGSTNTGFCQTRNDGYYRDPNNCNAYIHCTNHQSVTKYCPMGLAFNESFGTCSIPSLVPACSNYRAP